MSKVSELLTSSQRHHLDAQTCRKQKDRIGHVQHCADAFDLRLKAHGLDPDHSDLAWAQERTRKFHHDQLIAFYKHELGIIEGAAPLNASQLRERIIDAVKVKAR